MNKINLLFSLRQGVRSFFTNTSDSRDPGKLKDMLGRLIFLRVLILSAIFGFTCWSLFTNTSDEVLKPVGVFWAIGFIYAVSILNALLLRLVTNLKLFSYAQLVVDVILATLAISVTNSAVSILLYLLVIVAAALVSSRNGAVIIAAVSGLMYGSLTSGLFPALSGHHRESSSQDILVVYLSMIIIALVSGYLARQLELVGSLADQTAKDLSHVNAQQKQLFDDMSEGIIMLDLEQTITGINQAARSILGLSSLDAVHFVGQPIKEILEKRGISNAEHLFERNQNSVGNSELTLKKAHSNEDVRIDYTVKPLSAENGSERGKIIIFNDVSHIRSIEERLHLHEQMTKLLADTSNSFASRQDSHINYEMAGDSPIMKRVYALVERVAASEASVLINGESGTGKELIARAIHNQGPRRRHPFVAINCGAIPENLIESELFGHKKGAYTGAVGDSIGLFRQAQSGTIFLDEIGELPPQMQTKLLRVLQERTIRAVGDVRDVPVDVRIIAATNRDLKKEIQSGRFREDLYYRLNVVNVIVPPLRERKEDIPLLVRHFVGDHCDPDKVLPQISPEALQLLSTYNFPGNIRELENIIERALVLGGQAILPEHLPEEVVHFTKGELHQHDASLHSKGETQILTFPLDLEKELEKVEREYLFRALEEAGGVKKNAAELLGLNFRSFRYRLKKYGLGDTGPNDSLNEPD